jgi:Mg-chelatase subunit ChlD
VGSTNTGDAIILGNEEINSGRHNQDARKVFVLLTDGLANAPGDEPETYAIEAADALKETDVEVYAIGLGDRVNETFLRQIASDNEHYFQAASASTVDSIYQSITAAICEDGAAVIEIIPKTTTSFPTLR